MAIHELLQAYNDLRTSLQWTRTQLNVLEERHIALLRGVSHAQYAQYGSLQWQGSSQQGNSP